MALLDITAVTHASEDTSYVTATAPKTPVSSKPETETVARNRGRRGRKKGSGTKDDSISLRAMLDLLVDGGAPSVTAASASFVKSKMDLHEGDNETSAQSWIARLRRKFAGKYGTEPPPGKTWDDVRKTVDV